MPDEPTGYLFEAALPVPERFESLAALEAACGQCQRCPLGARRTRIVVARGPAPAPLMLIGEGPGEQEDRQGLPFVGPAGQLLDRVLASVGLSTQQGVHLANLVKCRPPGNRVPEPQELAACRGFLEAQIRLVRPKLILLVGGTATKAVWGEVRGITRLRGSWRDWRGIPTMAVFHPSYLLRNDSREKGSPKWLMWQDIRAVRARLDAVLGDPNPSP